ncbi:proline and serine-rich protein 3 isoform X4 [Salmo salar]|uniref:Proline and serine-rich protein 3 isoform X4 n=1 Tax=Salmo salar TaxID=8030 RepID=A0A1S3N919_SALSA|nr:proline and serine-rich protein 3 isoform X4 [Salmo salar]|eukprot:XP_014011907.1 PREDICTED: proline and serine-rich protein 3-like isoform X2 [Salmo salar]
MKSSGAALFTRKNPFPSDPPLGKTHYNPSRTKKLPKQQRKTTLSPVRLAQLSSPPHQTHTLSPEDQCFLGAANHFVLCPPPATEAQPSFLESWPSTDLGSSPANTAASPNRDTLTRDPTSGKSLVSTGGGEQEDSVLAKYIERFRHGRPQSREERQQMSAMVGEGQQPFWWLSSSPLPSSSTPTQTTDIGLSLKDSATTLSPVGQFWHGTTLSPCRGLLDLSAMGLSDSSHGDLGDSEILHLQEKASRLLHRSSEGLGCSNFSSPVSIDEPVRRPIVTSLIDSTTVVGNLGSADLYAGTAPKPSVVGPPDPRTCPEEDILFQWRLRRKMEQASQWVQSNPQQGYTLHQHAVSCQAHKVQWNPLSAYSSHRVAPSLPISSPTISKLQPDAPVRPHMHLLCDILPCTAQPHSPPPSHQRSPKRSGVSGADRTVRQPKAQFSSTDTSTEEPTSKHESSPPPPALSETTEEEWAVQQRRTERTKKETLQKERSEKRTGPSCRKKKSARCHVGDRDHAERPSYADWSVSQHHTRGKDRVIPWREEPSRDWGQQERGPGVVREGCPGDRAPPPSPIHSALGQVVSEVLFLTTDSPDPPRTPVSSDSPRYMPPQSPAPPPSAQQPREVVAQLLQEAEDSDEQEFKDDPLLKVLRQQRKWVKEQIGEVDSLLDEFEEE